MCIDREDTGGAGNVELSAFSVGAKTKDGLMIQQAITAETYSGYGSGPFGLEAGISTEITLFFDTDKEITSIYAQSLY